MDERIYRVCRPFTYAGRDLSPGDEFRASTPVDRRKAETLEYQRRLEFRGFSDGPAEVKAPPSRKPRATSKG
jgi:hypothetical protein